MATKSELDWKIEQIEALLELKLTEEQRRIMMVILTPMPKNEPEKREVHYLRKRKTTNG